jgi:hypothetical protein
MSSHILGFGKLRAGVLAVLFLLTAAPGFAGTCASGPDRGKTCFSSNDCRHFCSGGPNANQACISASDCHRSCSGGVDAGKICLGDADCRHTCSGGTRAGTSCFSSSDCLGGGACLAYACLSYACLSSACSGSSSLAAGSPLAAIFEPAPCGDAQPPARSISAK